MDTAADRMAILELANAFENAFDRGDKDAHLATWTDNPSLESSMGSYEGVAAYREWLDGFYAQTQAAGGTRHLITNSVVELSGDRATASFYLTVINRKTGLIMGTATFDDRLVRTPEGWRFEHRRLAVDDNLNV